MSDCLMFILQNKTLTYNDPIARRFDYWHKFFDLINLIESLGTNIKTTLKMYEIIGFNFYFTFFCYNVLLHCYKSEHKTTPKFNASAWR